MSKPNRFQYRFNKYEEDLLNEIAKLKGFSNYKRFISKEIIKLPKLIQKELKCTKYCKKAVNFNIPIEVQEFYKKLSESHNAPISTVIMQYITFPAIREYLIKKNEENTTQ